MIHAMISNLKYKERRNEPLLECDYSRITSVLLPYYFSFSNNWCISPEWVATERDRPDYTVFWINFQVGNLYGEATPYLIAEIKNRVAVSWWVLFRNQLWEQADKLKQENGRLWVIGQIGFEICFFKFYIERHGSASND